MSLKIYNTLTQKKEEFVPLNSKFVGMYVCGPTVYGYPHLGHAKSYVFFDIVNRYLSFLDYKVKYVQNITDVGHLVNDADEGEDKIQKQAKKESLDPYAIAYKYENIYFECMDKLNIKRPTISCRATGHIIEIIEMIKTLIDKGYAYVTEKGNVYYDISKFKDYGCLSNRSITDALSGKRINVATDKRHEEDFALWKKADNTHIMKWNSPWSIGYPGWHIECSVMAKKYLTDSFDIHGGGMENMFPHHECEIAQSTSANGHPFAKYFIHNNLLTINGQKMGKSLGNFITLPDLFSQYNPNIIRFYLLQFHYRKPTDFEDKKLFETILNYNKICSSFKSLPLPSDKITTKEIQAIADKFLEAMNDDFNTSLAITYIYDLMKLVNKTKDEDILKDVAYFNETYIKGILGLIFDSTRDISDLSDSCIIYLIELRNKFRKEKNYLLADEIRDKLSSLNIEINERDPKPSYKIKM
ncbi:MAG: cysteine--tRNA ligase [bacterium]|nr:cysteine--tRNA ligase [bacterium]